MEDQIYIYHAEMCKMLSHPKRLEIINLLRDGELNVTELSLKLRMSPANLSQHLALMRERKILIARKEGNVVYYRLANIRFLEAFDILREILVEQIRQDASLVEAVS
ncbi:MAG: regulatory protein ArsR [Dehalococcoidia bacterium]|nr:regulatory protein ArsR [Dehalococcoidia bacterium]MBF8304235.1 regulatory protein ArsR [Dehalococcoidia bacterium]